MTESRLMEQKMSQTKKFLFYPCDSQAEAVADASQTDLQSVIDQLRNLGLFII